MYNLSMSHHDVARLRAALGYLHDLWPTLTTPGQLRALQEAMDRISAVLVDHGEDV